MLTKFSKNLILFFTKKDENKNVKKRKKIKINNI